MAIFKRKRADREAATPQEAAHRSVLAAAVPLTGPEAERYASARQKQTAEGWQNDAWYFYDAVGELSAPVNWIASAVSKADLFGAELDPATGLVTGPTEDTRAQAAAALCLGGAARRAQLQFILAVCWQVPGEAYVVIRARAARNGVPQPDEWLVLSGRKVRAKGSVWSYEDPVTLAWIELGGTDRLIRVWAAHPNDQSKATSAVRPALSVLREIEKASMNLAAVLDSRIATAGAWAIPQEIDLPGRADGETNAEAFSDMLLRAASAGLTSPGTAAAQVPVILEVPAEQIDALVRGRMMPDTTMDRTVIDLRQEDISRLRDALDMPKETAEGSTAGMNHWGSWQVEETTYKLFIEPLLDRFGDAMTEFWYRPVLRLMGIPNPEIHTLAWDTTGIVSRPDSTEDIDHLYDLGLISDDYRRQSSGIPDDAIPAEEERERRYLEKVVLASPALLESPPVATALGFEEIARGMEDAAEEEREAETRRLEAARDAQEDTGAPDNVRALPGRPASTDDAPDGLVAAAELIVFDALSRAGGRLLTREHRGQFASTDKWELHTVIPVAAADVDRLLADSFQFAGRVALTFGRSGGELEETLAGYCAALLRTGARHRTDVLREALKR